MQNTTQWGFREHPCGHAGCYAGAKAIPQEHDFSDQGNLHKYMLS